MARIHNPSDSLNWWGSTAPTSAIIGATAIWVGADFLMDVDGRIMGARCYKPFGRTESQMALLLDYWGPKMQAKPFFYVSNGADQWQQVWFRPAIPVLAGQYYRLWVLYPSGAYRRTANALTLGPVPHGHISLSKGYTTTGLDPSTATVTANNHANGIDILWRAGARG
jgi:hypothetical protein